MPCLRCEPNENVSRSGLDADFFQFHVEVKTLMCHVSPRGVTVQFNILLLAASHCRGMLLLGPPNMYNALGLSCLIGMEETTDIGPMREQMKGMISRSLTTGVMCSCEMPKVSS